MGHSMIEELSTNLSKATTLPQVLWLLESYLETMRESGMEIDEDMIAYSQRILESMKYEMKV